VSRTPGIPGGEHKKERKPGEPVQQYKTWAQLHRAKGSEIVQGRKKRCRYCGEVRRQDKADRVRGAELIDSLLEIQSYETQKAWN
jgi:hypothetical protein